MKEGRDTTQLRCTFTKQRIAAHSKEMLRSVARGLKKCLTDHCNNISLHNANTGNTIKQLWALCLYLSLPSNAQG